MPTDPSKEAEYLRAHNALVFEAGRAEERAALAAHLRQGIAERKAEFMVALNADGENAPTDVALCIDAETGALVDTLTWLERNASFGPEALIPAPGMQADLHSDRLDEDSWYEPAPSGDDYY